MTAVDASVPAICEIEQPGCTHCVELEVELNRTRSERGYWQSMHSKAVEREQKLKMEIEVLTAKLKLREDQLFRRKSEKAARARGSEEAQNEAAPQTKRKPGRQPGSVGHGRHHHENLPVQEEWTDLAEQDKCCPQCQEPLLPLYSPEDSEVVEVEVKAYRRRIRRRRYRPGCKCGAVPGTVIAPGVPKLIPGGSYGVSFWVEVLLDKFLLQRPTNRLLLYWKLEMGLKVSPGTIAGGLKWLAPLFEPLFEPLLERNLSEGHWHADETRWLVLADVPDKHSSRWWLWVFAAETSVVFYIEPSRSSEVPKAHFGKEAEGILNVDRYSAYKALIKEVEKLILAFCWAHVRRDFLGVERQWPSQQQWAQEWVDRIGQLYRLNDERLMLAGKPAEYEAADAVLREAIEQTARVRDEQLSSAELRPPARKVLQSLKKHWDGLTVFVEHPEVPMDNNAGERQVRNPVVGRKNYYGSHSLWSSQLAAMLFSLFQTLLLWKINPKVWLTAYLEHCAVLGGQPPTDVTAYLPWKMTPEQLNRFRGFELLGRNVDTS
jgi:transposase